MLPPVEIEPKASTLHATVWANSPFAGSLKPLDPCIIMLHWFLDLFLESIKHDYIRILKSEASSKWGIIQQHAEHESRRHWVHIPTGGNILLLDFFLFSRDSVQNASPFRDTPNPNGWGPRFSAYGGNILFLDFFVFTW